MSAGTGPGCAPLWRRLRGAGAAVAGGLLLLSAAQHPAGRAPFPRTFPPGERLTFSARSGTLEIGRAVMLIFRDDTLAGEPTRHFQLSINANVLGAYRIDDKFDSWVRISDGVSRRVVEDYDETRGTRRDEFVIVPDSGYYRLVGANARYRTTAQPLDGTAFLYWVRSLDLVPGTTLRLQRYFRPQYNPITITVLRRDTIDVPAGRFPTLVVHAVIPDGGLLFSQSADSRMWISDDDRRLVVQLKANLAPYVTVSLALERYALPTHP